jgi:hypothetical protein
MNVRGRAGSGVSRTLPFARSKLTGREVDFVVLGECQRIPPPYTFARESGPSLGLTSFTGFIKITSTIPIITLSLNADVRTPSPAKFATQLRIRTYALSSRELIAPE